MRPLAACRVLLAVFVAVLVLALPAAAGDPPLEPGHHRAIPSDGAPERTFDLRLPKAYAGSGTRALPVLYVFGPGGNPNTGLFARWAEENAVIVVGVNSSRNGPGENNITAQDLCRATLRRMGVRIHPHLGFTVGFSGGAQSGWLFAMRYPDEFAGLLMCGQGGHQQLPAKHIAVAYVRGEQEPNNHWIATNTRRLRKQGNPVQEIVIPGGHVMGDGRQHSPLLSWMLDLARIGHPRLSAAERAEGEALLTARIAALGQLADQAEVLAQAEVLLSLTGIEQRRGHAELLARWQAAAFARAVAATPAAQRHYDLVELGADPRFARAASAAAAQRQLADLRRDPAIRAEWEAHQVLLRIRPEEAAAKAGTSRARLAQVAKAYTDLAKRWPGTIPGAKARDALARLGEE